MRAILKYIKMSNRYNPEPISANQQPKYQNKYFIRPWTTLKISQNLRKKSHSLFHQDRQKERLLKIQDTKMMLSLQRIYNGQGLLSRMEKQSIQKQHSKARSRSTNYKKEQAEREIERENTIMVQAILHAEPVIGSKKLWNKQFEQHLEIKKRLCAYSQNQCMNRTQFKNTMKQMKKRILIPKETAEKHSTENTKIGKDNILEMMFLNDIKK